MLTISSLSAPAGLSVSLSLTPSSTPPPPPPPFSSSARRLLPVRPQVLSTKESAPAFSFGTSKARVSIKLCGIPKPDALTPSAPPRMDGTPGHKYSTAPRPSLRGPRFGSELQRPPPPTAAKVSAATGWSTEPGPGAYTLPSAMGFQALAGRKSNMPQSIAALPNGRRGPLVRLPRTVYV